MRSSAALWRYTCILRKDTRLILPSKSPVNWKSFRVSTAAESICEPTNSLTTIQPQIIVRLVHQGGANLTTLVQSDAP